LQSKSRRSFALPLTPTLMATKWLFTFRFLKKRRKKRGILWPQAKIF
jgi:hypothetical protein